MKSRSVRSWFLICVLGIACVAAAFTFANEFIAPLLFNSRVERLHEADLPKAMLENGYFNSYVYCRMKADDFRLPLPAGLHARPPVIIAGGYDWVDGSVELRYDGSSGIGAGEYARWLPNRLQVGGSATVEHIPGGIVIKFHYFGDKQEGRHGIPVAKTRVSGHSKGRFPWVAQLSLAQPCGTVRSRGIQVRAITGYLPANK
jgi:hypothetical protein